MKKLTNQIVWGCTIIGIAVGFIDIYIGEHILTHEGAAKGILCITTGIFCVNRITKFQENSDKESE